jgi:hypothetical protein
MSQRSGIFKGANDVVSISSEWVMPNDEDEDRRYMSFFNKIGDDADGFHHPIMQGVASWINYHGEPEANARTEIKRLVRSYVDDAEVSPDRSPSEMDRYQSDEFLDTLIDGAINKGFARGTKAKVDLSELLKEYIYVSYEEGFYHPRKDLTYTASAVKNAHASMAPNKNIAKLLLESVDLKMVDTIEFVPGVEEKMSMHKGRRIYNSWEPRKILPTKEDIDVSTFTNHLKYLTDADHDGIGHISPLLIAFFYKFWPRLLTEKRVNITRTPIMISTKDKDVKWFYTYEDASKFKTERAGWKHRYIKGLGSLEESEYDKIINQPVYDTVTVDDASVFQMMFGKESQLRKEYMFA